MKSIVVIATSALAAATGLILAQPYRTVLVQGRSMDPTFHDGQVALYGPLEGEPRPGQVVLLEHDGTILIKRVALTSGQTVTEAYIPSLRHWYPVETKRAYRAVKRRNLARREEPIPSGYVYVLGDNPSESYDSRNFGLVPVGEVKGVVLER